MHAQGSPGLSIVFPAWRCSQSVQRAMLLLWYQHSQIKGKTHKGRELFDSEHSLEGQEVPRKTQCMLLSEWL